MLYVSYCKESSTSAKVLAEKLECKAFHSRKTKKYPYFERGDIVINYGSSVLYTPDFVEVFNLPAAVAKSANKKWSRELLTKAGIPLPRLYKHIPDITSYPVIGRPDQHTQGKHFWFCLNRKDALKSYRRGASHWMEYLRNTKELRIHVISSVPDPKNWEDYLSIKASVKLPIGKDAHPVIKNYENGYRFFSAQVRSGLSEDKLMECRNIAKRAAFALGLHFAGVDLVVSYGNVYVLETNTSCCLANVQEDAENTTADRYVNAIRKYLLQEREEEE